MKITGLFVLNFGGIMKVSISDHFTYKKLIRFTLPTIFMMIFTSIYGIVDGIFVSNFAGKDAFASVNLIYPAIMVLGAFGFMIGAGGSALVSKTLGEGDSKKANQYFSMLIYLEIIVGIILSVIGYLTIGPMAKLLGATEELMPYCVLYGKVLFVGLTAFFLQNTFQSFLIVADRPQMGLVISVIAGIANMILDYVLVYVFQMGIFGAGLATIISQFVGALVPLIYFSVNNRSLLKLTKTKFELKPIVKTCTNGSSEMVSNISMSLVNILYNFQLMKYAGSDGVSAYGIIMYVGFIFVGIFLGYSFGSAPIISYHFGAQNKEELKGVFLKSIKILASSAIVLTLLAEMFAKPLAGIFVSYDEELFKLTIRAIRIFSISYIISWFNIYASSFFTALNNGLVSAILSFLRTLVFQIVMIYLLPIYFGIDGIWFAIVIAEAFSLIVSLLFLIKNKKKYGYN